MTKPTDVRELRERLDKMIESSEGSVVMNRGCNPYYANYANRMERDLATLREAAAALERICRNDIGASFDQRYVEERVRDFASWERGFSDALSIVQRIAGRALATPAPAPQQGRDG